MLQINPYPTNRLNLTDFEQLSMVLKSRQNACCRSVFLEGGSFPCLNEYVQPQRSQHSISKMILLILTLEVLRPHCVQCADAGPRVSCPHRGPAPSWPQAPPPRLALVSNPTPRTLCSHLYPRDSFSNSQDFDTGNQSLVFPHPISEGKKSGKTGQGGFAALSGTCCLGRAQCSLGALSCHCRHRKTSTLSVSCGENCVYLDCDTVLRTVIVHTPISLRRPVSAGGQDCLHLRIKFSLPEFLKYGGSLYICEIFEHQCSHSTKLSRCPMITIHSHANSEKLHTVFLL